MEVNEERNEWLQDYMGNTVGRENTWPCYNTSGGCFRLRLSDIGSATTRAGRWTIVRVRVSRTVEYQAIEMR